MRKLYIAIFALFLAGTVFAADENPFLPPKHIRGGWGVWAYEFDMNASFSKDGTVTPVVSGLRQKYGEAWSSISSKAEVINIKQFSEEIRVNIKVEIKGRTRQWSAPFATANDPNTWKWGELSKEETVHTYTYEIWFPFDKYPELRKIERFSASAPVEVAAEQQKPPVSVVTIDDSIFDERRTCIMFFEGDVMITKPDGRTVRAEVNMDLEIGDKIESGANSKATIALAGTAVIRIHPQTTFIIPEDKSNTKVKVSFIEMIRGVLWARAKKDDDSLKVYTPNAVCGVRGTEFEISYLDNKTCVNVIKGKVWLSDKTQLQKQEISAGSQMCLPLAAREVMLIAGTWSSSFGNITFTQNGNIVSGIYTHDKGKIEGRLEGDILRGTWSESPTYKPTRDAGDLEFIFSADAKSFKGNWRYGSEKQTWDGSWNGNR